MKENNMKLAPLKEIELALFQLLQKTFSQVMIQCLEELDAHIASSRDKKRYYLHDKREMTLETMFGPITLKRNYYRDRQKNKYICLLDHYLAFDGAKGASPLVEEFAMELAVQGPSYRHASS